MESLCSSLSWNTKHSRLILYTFFQIVITNQYFPKSLLQISTFPKSLLQISIFFNRYYCKSVVSDYMNLPLQILKGGWEFAGLRLFSLISVMIALFMRWRVEEPMRRQIVRPMTNKTVAMATAPKPTERFLMFSPFSVLVLAAASRLNRKLSKSSCNSFVIHDDFIQCPLSLCNKWPWNIFYLITGNYVFSLIITIFLPAFICHICLSFTSVLFSSILDTSIRRSARCIMFVQLLV